MDDAGKRLVPGKLREWVDAQGAENLSDASNNPPPRVGEQCTPSLRGGFASTPQRDVTQAAAMIVATFKHFEPIGHNLTSKLSAEIHSLARMQLEIKDRVLLLASDTSEGLACAQAVEAYLVRYWDGLQVVTETVPGLQVDDAEQFRRVGVVEFSRSRFEAFKPLFERIERDSSVSLYDWDRDVPFEERATLEPLVEHIGQEVTLSAIGLLFLDEVRTATTLVPFLSRQAWDDGSLSRLGRRLAVVGVARHSRRPRRRRLSSADCDRSSRR